jgi:hypothetical protein
MSKNLLFESSFANKIALFSFCCITSFEKPELGMATEFIWEMLKVGIVFANLELGAGLTFSVTGAARSASSSSSVA